MTSRPQRVAAVLPLALAAIIIAVLGCSGLGSGGGDVEACPVIEASAVPGGPPPALPYIFQGTYYVDGEPGPGGVKIWVQLARSWSTPSETLDDGRFYNVIHGPIQPEDFDAPFVFCIGEMDGNSVKAASTPIPYEEKGTFHTLADLRVDFPSLP